MYAPFSAQVENIDLSLNHWRKAREKYLKRYSHRITADFVEAWRWRGVGICEVCLNADCNQTVSEKPHRMSLSETPCRNYSHSLITLMSWAAFLSSINFSPWEQSEKSNSSDLKWVLSLKKKNTKQLDAFIRRKKLSFTLFITVVEKPCSYLIWF